MAEATFKARLMGVNATTTAKQKRRVEVKLHLGEADPNWLVDAVGDVLFIHLDTEPPNTPLEDAINGVAPKAAVAR